MVKRFRRLALQIAAVALVVAMPVGAASPSGAASISSRDLREWLTYIASDDLQGRAVFSSGIGLAAAYIEDHLRAWGVTPGGDNGSFLQTVRVLGVKASSHSTVTVEVGGERRVFADGQGVRFPRNAGATQHLEIDRVDFVGYGLDISTLGHEDYRGKDASGGIAVWLGPRGPATVDQATYRLLLNARGRYATENKHAAASIGAGDARSGAAGEPARAGRAVQTGEAGQPGRAEQLGQPEAAGQAAASARGVSAAAGQTGERGREGGRADAAPPPPQGRGRGAIPAADFTTTERLDHVLPPTVTGTDEFFTFLFSHAPVHYEELKRKADAREPLPSFRLADVKVTVDVNADYEVVRTELAHNVVGIVEGSDAQLKKTYVAFGAHYDHVGYAEGELVAAADGSRRRLGAPGRVTAGAEDDRIWNGADDDGSGTVTMMALARAFATGAKPKRSLLFVWHVGEERGRWGSLYFADHPTIPLDRVVAQLNIDMVGRNRDNKSSESNTVYLVGSDRISRELDAVARAANEKLSPPMHLDYQFNDPSDPEQLYYRSDHYSYAAKDIPVIFFTTGLHPDYHANTDEVGRIEFDKMTHVAQLVYETGARLANLDHPPVHDDKGPRPRN